MIGRLKAKGLLKPAGLSIVSNLVFLFLKQKKGGGMLRRLSLCLFLASLVMLFGCKISGIITDDNGALEGVTVELSGDAAMTAITNSEGRYVFNYVMPGSYTVTPSESGMVFDPENATVNKYDLFVNVEDIDFERIPIYISGTIFDDGALLEGATVELSGDATMTAITNSEGQYVFNYVMPGSYTVTPTKSGITFYPASDAVTISQVPANVEHINFETTQESVRKVFLSVGKFYGDFGGLSFADEYCQTEAETAGLSGTYKAWLSDSMESVADRFYKGGGPFILPDIDGTVVADNWTDLTDGRIQHGIDVRANSTYQGGLNAWTATDFDGTNYRPDQTCNDWTESQTGSFARSGLTGCRTPTCTDRTDENWTSFASIECTGEFNLYCFQQDYN